MTSANSSQRQPETGSTDPEVMFAYAVKLDKSRDYEGAMDWYRRAAEAGSQNAMHNLAVRLRYRGERAEAAIWWERAGHKREQRMAERLRAPREQKARNQSRSRRRSR
ncbi:hypothetical protein [Nocardia transvalensis]|uniref:hypothetical protein n=1 Tax=Nocardia transvalensis TaxID=37333 RepID=UPI001894E851|nr:hypothetical protein [Nocardia transvalensis]MBF6333468.1 hypothetical protein [Nocardia transvalensis]